MDILALTGYVGWYLLAFIFAIMFVVGFHEYGHFITARLLGIRVLRYSMGMGKVIYQRKSKAGIEYAVSLLPIGGYVEMLDESNLREGETYTEEELKHAFNRAPLWKRFLVVLNGPLFNFVLAFFIYLVMNLGGYSYYKPYVGHIPTDSWAATQGLQPGDLIKSIGGQTVQDWPQAAQSITAELGNSNVPVVVSGQDGSERTLSSDFTEVTLSRADTDLLGRMGLVPVHVDSPNVAGQVMPGSPAEKAGLLSGDVLTSLNGHEVSHFHEIKRYVGARPGETLEVQYLRDGRSGDVILVANGEKGSDDRGLIGIMPLAVESQPHWVGQAENNLLEATVKSWDRVCAAVVMTASTISKLVTGELPVTMISGPVGIAKAAGNTASYGVIAYFSFIALLSVNLMIMNLLPIPMLDGGHLAQYIVEGTIRRPLSENTVRRMQRAGYCLLMGLIGFAIVLDVMDFF